MRLILDAKRATLLLDFKTLSLMIVISSFLYAVTIAFFALQANQYKGINLYMRGAICAAIGFLAGAFVAVFPGLSALRFVGGSFLMLACYFYCLGIARFLDFNFSSRGLSSFLALGLAAFAYFTYSNTGNGTAKILTVFFYAIVFYSIACSLLWQRRHENFAMSLYAVLLSLILIILIFIVTSYIVIVLRIGSLAEHNPTNTGLLMGVFISGYLRNVGFIMMVSHRLYQDLRDAALQDFLTKIYNRRATQQFLDQQFKQFQNHQNDCSIILLDIDYFKLVNDNHGHEAGDKILQTIARILKANLRKTDILGRWGGEEFLIILPGTHLSDAISVAEKLRSEVAKEEFEGIFCTISLGVKMFDKHNRNIDEALKCTDAALYRAKIKGRNRVETSP